MCVFVERLVCVFIGQAVLCCRGLCSTRLSMTTCFCVVLFCHVFCENFVLFVSMCHVLLPQPRPLFPDYWFIYPTCPTWFPSLFFSYLFSLCPLSFASSLSYISCVLFSLALLYPAPSLVICSSPALPAMPNDLIFVPLQFPLLFYLFVFL